MSKRRKAHEKEPNLERWLVSYADFITLLFAVFVTLYAMSQVDKQKTEQVIQSLRSAFGLTAGGGEGVIHNGDGSTVPMLLQPQIAPGGVSNNRHAGRNDLARAKAALENYLESVQANDKVRLSLDQRGLVISLAAANFFPSGSAEINPEVYPLLEQVAEVLAAYDNPISIEGFTDSFPIRSARYPTNWELSSARALSLLHFMIDRQAISPARLSATGFGEQRPIADNTTEEGRQRNRRVDFVVPVETHAREIF